MAAIRGVVLFGAGSPVIVEVEESCARLGWNVQFIVKNFAGVDYASEPGKIVPPRRLERREVVAAGAVLRREVPAGATVAGNPARITRSA